MYDNSLHNAARPNRILSVLILEKICSNKFMVYIIWSGLFQINWANLVIIKVINERNIDTKISYLRNKSQ